MQESTLSSKGARCRNFAGFGDGHRVMLYLFDLLVWKVEGGCRGYCIRQNRSDSFRIRLRVQFPYRLIFVVLCHTVVLLPVPQELSTQT